MPMARSTAGLSTGTDIDGTDGGAAGTGEAGMVILDQNLAQDFSCVYTEDVGSTGMRPQMRRRKPTVVGDPANRS